MSAIACWRARRTNRNKIVVRHRPKIVGSKRDQRLCATGSCDELHADRPGEYKSPPPRRGRHGATHGPEGHGSTQQRRGDEPSFRASRIRSHEARCAAHRWNKPHAQDVGRLPVGSLQNSPNRVDLTFRRRLARLAVLREMLPPEIGFELLPPLSGYPSAAKNRALKRPTGCVDERRYPCSFCGSISARSALGTSTVEFYRRPFRMCSRMANGLAMTCAGWGARAARPRQVHRLLGLIAHARPHCDSCPSRNAVHGVIDVKLPDNATDLELMLSRSYLTPVALRSR